MPLRLIVSLLVLTLPAIGAAQGAPPAQFSEPTIVVAGEGIAVEMYNETFSSTPNTPTYPRGTCSSS